MEELEARRDRNYFLLTGPIGGVKDPRFPEIPKEKWNIPWTAKCSESAVRRFLGEAKYYLNIYNVVVQHFVSILFEKYFEDDDTRRGEKKRDSFHAVLWNANTLEELLNSQVDTVRATLPEVDDHDPGDLEVEKSFQSLRELMASSSIQDSETATEARSLLELLRPRTSSEPTLMSRLKDRFSKLLDDEVAKLKSRLQRTLPEFAEKNVNKLNKLVAKTLNYSDLIIKIENDIDSDVQWAAWDGRNAWRSTDLRERNMSGANHVIYAPFFVVEDLAQILIYAHSLLKRTNELEKVMSEKGPEEYIKLLASKKKILIPTEHCHFLERPQ